MIALADLRKTARSYLRAAGLLHRSHSHDAAVYLCGYAVEIALKARICRTLKWTDFPATAGEFQKFRSLQTHDLTTLLKFSGLENRIKLLSPLTGRRSRSGTRSSVTTQWGHRRRQAHRR